jgi:thiol-disulfide isomerase/thioredoxin
MNTRPQAAADAPAAASTRRRRLVLLGVGAIAAAAGIAGAVWQSGRGRAEPPVADSIWGLRFARPAGGELALADFRGRPLLINFWATWCPPCIRELPEVDRFAAAHGQTVQVIGLAIDRDEPVREFLARQPVGFPVGLATLDGTELSRTLGNRVGGLPFTALLDARGSVVRHKAGETSQTELEGWLRSL